MFVSKVLRSPSRIKDLCLLICSLFIFYLLLHLPYAPPPILPLHASPPTTTTTTTTTRSTTTLRHLVFSIAASAKSLPNRIPYLRLWYCPNSTRAFVFLDRPTVASVDPTLPPALISADTSAFPYSFPRGSRAAIRIARIVKEVVLLNEPDVRWFVFGDDDTVFFTDNLVRTLSKYDHNQWYYVGSSSESYEQNSKYSFDMAFGGGGFAISHSLARALAGVLDSCLMRYSHLYGSDARVFSCLAELGVGLNREPGFHQVDVRGDLFGMLSAHPLSPLLSLHHFDLVEPIFPNMTRTRALEHLFKAVNVDPGRILQQTVCYDHSNSLTVSVAWGYAVQVFEGNYLLPDLLQLQRTFRSWRRNRDIISSLYMFNTREYLNDPCKRPVAFFLESVASGSNKVWTDYARHIIGNCSRTRAVYNLEQIRVFSQKLDFDIGEDSWPRRKDYVKLWWRLNQMRGCVFLDRMPPPNSASHNDTGSLPPICISEDTSRFRYTHKGGLRSAIRVARVVSETVALNHSNVRWFVFGDDDTVFFSENLVKTLSKYDHQLWHYIGTISESYLQNKGFSFSMAYGGGGFAISYPLAKVLAKVFDPCLERYPHLFGSDGRVAACIAELGIGLAREPGFHQMDMKGNIFGLLASHPNTPLVSLHHLDLINPIFPNMTTTKSLEHLLEAAKIDPHRLLQQTVCYDRWFSWTISVSWGYAVQVFANHVLLPEILRPEQTFTPWQTGFDLAESFTFNTRKHHPDPCQRPTVFFFDKADFSRDGIKSSYRRMVPENCRFDMSSAKKFEEVRVFSRKLDLDIKQLQAPRRHCCDVLPSSGGKVMEIDIRQCKEDELIYMHP